MKNLYTKILAVQKELKAIGKDSENPYFHSRYFDINTVIAELRPIIDKHGLVVMQPLGSRDGVPVISTMMADPESGESMTFDYPLLTTPDPQKQGAILTYFRRYALVSAFLLQGEEDDDGNSASGKTTEPTYEQDGITCEVAGCGGVMRERKGAKGAFLGCSKYPTCKNTRNV
jgi:hypothetical protein